MKANARKAFNELKKIGAPVFDTYNSGQPLEGKCHFAISGEMAGADDYNYPGEKNTAPDGMCWAEYYSEDYEERWSRFGVHNAINDILDKHELYAEWYDCGSLRVYDA
ncbi:MAG: hypothetical protein ACR2PH_11265 [Desulfobulbia bacterium]